MVVAQRVVDEVGNELLRKARISRDGGRFERGAGIDSPCPRFCATIAHDRLRDRGEVEGFPSRESRVSACEREQRIDEPLLLLTGGNDSLVCGAQRLERGFRIGERNLRDRPLARERRAQLV